jgi:hypothetical protein
VEDNELFNIMLLKLNKNLYLLLGKIAGEFMTKNTLITGGKLVLLVESFDRSNSYQ